MAILQNNLLSYALVHTYADEKNSNKIYIGTNELELSGRILPNNPYLIEDQLIHVVMQPKIHKITGVTA